MVYGFMFQDITYYLIFDIPFIVYLGIITFLLFFVTASIAGMRRRGIMKIDVKWHFRLAYVSLALAVVHTILGVAAYI